MMEGSKTVYSFREYRRKLRTIADRTALSLDLLRVLTVRLTDLLFADHHARIGTRASKIYYFKYLPSL